MQVEQFELIIYKSKVFDSRRVRDRVDTTTEMAGILLRQEFFAEATHFPKMTLASHFLNSVNKSSFMCYVSYVKYDYGNQVDGAASSKHKQWNPSC